MRYATFVAIALGLAVALAPAAAGATKTRGKFQTLAAGTELGLEMKGIAQLTRTEDGSAAKVVVRGLAPSETYAAHLHNAPCSDENPGGGHYKHDPAGPSAPLNELWLSSTDDALDGITANEAGVAHGRGTADWVARPEARSIVIHYIPPGGNTAGGPKIACSDLA